MYLSKLTNSFRETFIHHNMNNIIVINHHADDINVVKFVILIFYKKEFSIYSIIIARVFS